MAWLLSDHRLSPEELDEAARRIRGGARISPDRALVEEARAELERAVPGRRRRPRPVAEAAEDDGLFLEEPPPAPGLAGLVGLDGAGPPAGRMAPTAVAALVLLNLVATPLVGWAAWFAWRRTSPRAARQVFRATFPVTVLLGLAWSVVVVMTWSHASGP